jgi:multimeric flavodoxin WrbA
MPEAVGSTAVRGPRGKVAGEMKSLGLVSSPRRSGNSELAVKEILRALPDAWEKRMIRLSDMNLIPCRACYACLAREDRSCVLKDDMEFILKHMLWADKIVIAAPCYILGAHIGVQRLIDRLMPVAERYACFADKQCALVISYGLPGWEGFTREEMLKIPHCLGMSCVGAVMMEATLPGDAVKGQYLQRLRTLAEALKDPSAGEPPRVSEDEVLLCPHCGSRLLTIRRDLSWRCALCDGSGAITQNPEGPELKADAFKGNRFRDDRRIAHERRLNKAKSEFIEHKTEIKQLQREYAEYDWWTNP